MPNGHHISPSGLRVATIGPTQDYGFWTHTWDDGVILGCAVGYPVAIAAARAAGELRVPLTGEGLPAVPTYVDSVAKTLAVEPDWRDVTLGLVAVWRESGGLGGWLSGSGMVWNIDDRPERVSPGQTVRDIYPSVPDDSAAAHMLSGGVRADGAMSAGAFWVRGRRFAICLTPPPPLGWPDEPLADVTDAAALGRLTELVSTRDHGAGLGAIWNLEHDDREGELVS